MVVVLVYCTWYRKYGVTAVVLRHTCVLLYSYSVQQQYHTAVAGTTTVPPCCCCIRYRQQNEYFEIFTVAQDYFQVRRSLDISSIAQLEVSSEGRLVRYEDIPCNRNSLYRRVLVHNCCSNRVLQPSTAVRVLICIVVFCHTAASVRL